MNTAVFVLNKATTFLPTMAWRLHCFILGSLAGQSLLLFAYKALLFVMVLLLLRQSFSALARNKRYGLLFASSRHVSRLFGLAMQIPIPIALRPLVLGLFARTFQIDLNELRYQLPQFNTIKQFFIRELKLGARPLLHGDLTAALTSPCDGHVLKAQEIKKGLLEAVKGRAYSMRQFLFGKYSDDRKAQLFMQKIKPLIEGHDQTKTKLMYTVIYLSPRDYHRFHAPTDLSFSTRRHIEGYLEPVKPAYIKNHPYVFKSNERVNLFGEWEQGEFLFSAVGALNVGSIHLLFEPWLSTNALKPNQPFYKEFSYKDQSNQALFLKTQKKLFHFMKADKVDSETQQLSETGVEMNSVHVDPQSYLLSEKGVEVERGQSMGYFNFGSTVVMLFETKHNWEFQVKEGQPIKMGQVLGHSS